MYPADMLRLGELQMQLRHQILDKECELKRVQQELDDLKQQLELARFEIMTRDCQLAYIRSLIHSHLTITMGRGLRYTDSNKHKRVKWFDHYKAIYHYDYPITDVYRTDDLP
jgi:virulence-associated protein VapD